VYKEHRPIVKQRKKRTSQPSLSPVEEEEGEGEGEGEDEEEGKGEEGVEVGTHGYFSLTPGGEEEKRGQGEDLH
jgi:hypothetical protein